MAKLKKTKDVLEEVSETPRRPMSEIFAPGFLKDMETNARQIALSRETIRSSALTARQSHLDREFPGYCREAKTILEDAVEEAFASSKARVHGAQSAMRSIWDQIDATYKALRQDGLSPEKKGNVAGDMSDLGKAEEEITKNFKQRINDAKTDWEDLAQDYSNAETRLTQFRKDYAVDRALANDHPNPAFVWAQIFFFLAVEIVLNAYFFIGATDAGLAGALSEVFVFAPLNIGMAVLWGLFSLRYVNLGRGKKQDPRDLRIAALARFSGYLLPLCILVFNFILMLLRISYEPDVATLLGLAAGLHPNLMEVLSLFFSPTITELLNIQTVGIFTFALALAGLAALKAYRMYDPVPGMSALSAELLEVREAGRQKRDEYIALVNEAATQTKQRLNTYLQEQYDRGGRYRAMHVEVTEELAHYNSVLEKARILYEQVEQIFWEQQAIGEGLHKTDYDPPELIMKKIDLYDGSFHEDNIQKISERVDVIKELQLRLLSKIEDQIVIYKKEIQTVYDV